ncbi:DUF2505 domain-containing protein [Actinotalea fermentans]|uniref:DUF2505 domain-containing protein n=1 Tax=Actinotalea fermentans TaxID=43671 RepID=A0A511Z2H9_9CELL|nr:DUF2505 domain-containing protein [Actinotalea fermentans]KGM15495.1 hypothetical protein N867_08005 [Actinotalea fermentans ATCC 43279 = JCM 9966 = DSM 3133]GEN81653.1 hypothetical protein AFE02nite_33870 [Actinotalea fermentans]
MHLHATLHYDAGVARVGRMLADTGFVEEKLLASGALSHHANVVGDPDRGFTVTTRREMPTDSIPPQFRTFVGSTLEVRHVEAWEPLVDGERKGSVVLEIVGAPVRFTGRLQLAPDGEGTVVEVDGELKATLPLFASALEEAASGAVRGALDAEQGAGAAWLARHPD